MLTPAASLAQQDADGSKPAGPPGQVDTAAEGTKPEPLPWLSKLDEGQRRALAEQKPVLVRVGAPWCPISRKLAAEIEKPQVQKELARWTLIYLDADRSVEDVKQLGITAVPALRIRTPEGRLVASRDGPLSHQELVAWLEEHHGAAMAVPDEVLLESGRPDALAVVRLVRQFGRRDWAAREAAIRRLLPYPDAARGAVIKAFREGDLAARLAALELLGEWKAPVEGLDPWRPETLTDQGLAKLQQWAEQSQVKPPSKPEQPSKEELALARRQIDRMLKATDAEAGAIRERLARLGAALLPEVYERLGKAATDSDRQRLLALRYRLVSSDLLVLRWPGGLVRLAATDPRERQQAAEELAQTATDDDQRLLLELFSDPDPLVREISLRGLQHSGGPQATAALVKLLADPEPNVRAAVLKQLEENPEPSLAKKVAEYLKTEKDPDLIVHAIRFLRAVGGPTAIKGMMPLLKHESWQVRAEAAAGIGGAETSFVRADSSPNAPGNSADMAALKADAYAALIELLDDPDAFVVSRAVEGLSGADMAVAVEPLVRAAKKHPDLASNIVEILADGDNMRPKALPHLREFCRHEDPRIRAAALFGLGRAARDSMDKELTAGLKDAESTVRVAAASVLFQALEQRREAALSAINSRSGGIVEGPFPSEGILVTELTPQVTGFVPRVIEVAPQPNLMSRALRALGIGSSTKPKQHEQKPPEGKPSGATEADKKPGQAADKGDGQDPQNDEPPENPWDEWLRQFYAGEGRPDWITPLIEPVEKMLRAEGAEERVSAGLALVPLGKGEQAMPVLLEAVRSDPKLVAKATRVLPWLVWQQRLDTFDQLRRLSHDSNDLWQLVYAMRRVIDRRWAEPFWELLSEDKIDESVADALEEGLRQAYYGQHYSSSSGVTPSHRRELAAAARPRATTGSEWQRAVALCLLLNAAPDEAVELARQMADDPKLSQALRRDAFQVLLAGLPKPERIQRAVAALTAEQSDRRALALAYFIDGTSAVRYLRGRITLSVGEHEYFMSHTSGQPIVPEPPPGLTAEQVRPLIHDPDPEIAASAGYLLCVFDEPAGLKPLLRYWRQQARDHSRWIRLVYRAIARLDDSTQIPVLKEIYGGLREYNLDEFYWTIRIMSGREILKFRKKIRDEVGMSKLL